jgi:hypothetical protein
MKGDAVRHAAPLRLLARCGEIGVRRVDVGEALRAGDEQLEAHDADPGPDVDHRRSSDVARDQRLDEPASAAARAVPAICPEVVGSLASAEDRVVVDRWGTAGRRHRSIRRTVRQG